MTRLLLSLALALGGILIVAGAIALLAYGGEPERSGTLRLEGLAGEVTMGWSESGEVTIEAQEEEALWTGLGYAHAADHGWSLALWRQAALGTLSIWTGPAALDLDRHARRLGFADLARQSYARLSADDRAAVDAYARGVRLAFADEAVAERDEFIELDIVAEPWEPWHALAVERLMAWLATEPIVRGREPAADSFAVADSLFRHALALGGLSHARAYVGQAETPSPSETTLGPGPILVYHQPYGASAIPLLIGTRLRLAGRETIAATVPGTLMLPAGTDAWAILLTSDVALSRDTARAPSPVYSRLVDREGSETLQAVLRDPDGLVLASPTQAPPDTLAIDAETGEPVLAAADVRDLGVRIQWAGFRLGSDVGAFRALLAGQAPTFSLLRGDGLRLRDGAVDLLGAPRVARESEGWWFVSGSEAGSPVIQRLGELAADSRLTPRRLAHDVGSPWSLTQTRALVRGLGNRDSLDLDLQDAYAFLRGWDGLYTPEAIAPSIAEAWIAAHRDVFGRAPDARQPLDSALSRFTLRLGLARLRDSLGTTPGLWTWDRFSGQLRQPLLEGIDRYAPAPALAGGHPTSPLPGSSLVLDAPPGPAVFSFWTDGRRARTDHPALPVVRSRGRDIRVIRTWPTLQPDRPRLRIVPS